MNNKYVKLVEEVNNISFSKVVNVLKRKLLALDSPEITL